MPRAAGEIRQYLDRLEQITNRIAAEKLEITAPYTPETIAALNSLLDAAMARYGRTLFDKRMMPASLDHAMWFHRPFRADEWVLYDCTSPSASGGRGLAVGRFYSRDGRLIATVVQEGLVRPRS